MITYTRELTVAWGESDPFGLVYYPMMFTWFNEAEHDLLRELGFSTNQLIKQNRTAFVMGDIHLRFLGPASYGDRVLTTSAEYASNVIPLLQAHKKVGLQVEVIPDGRQARP